MSEENKYPNSVLFQRIELLFTPALDWETCMMPLSTHDLLDKIKEAMPGFFEGDDHIIMILEEMHFQYAFNENNNKYYWLVNPA